jgi:predicted transcriptional regulator
MTICLLPETKKALKKLADKHSQKTAAMARILIESGVDIK